LGSVEVGKFADLVLWDPQFFGVKPKMVIKGGMINWANMGDPNASLPTPQPMYYRPMFGAFGPAMAKSSISFVAQTAIDNNIKERYGLMRKVMAVKGCRQLTKGDMVLNGATPQIEVNPENFEVRVDGKTVKIPAADKFAMAQLYWFS
jgi:urease subunit alpha